MAGYRRIQSGGSDRIATAPLHAGNPAVPLTALATVVVSIWRVKAGVVEWYDFADSTFKAAGWTTLQQAMTVVDATRAPGVYQYLWDTSAITNPEADDSYYYFATDTSATAKNIPQEGQLDVGQYVDDIDVAVSSRASAAALAVVQADTDDIQTRLPASLSGGRMRSQVEGMDASTVTATAIATDAIDSDALAASAVSEIQAGLATSAALAAVQADTDDIQTRLPATLSAGRMRAQVEGMDAGTVTATAVATGAVDADALAADAVSEIADGVWDESVAGHLGVGTFGRYVGRVVAAETAAVAGSSATEVRTGLTQADDFFNNMQVVVIGAAGIAARNVDDYANLNGAITVSALPFVPAPGDVVLVLSRTGSVPVNTGAIADAVWDEARAGHIAAGSFGETVRVIPAGAPNLDAAVSSRAAPGDAMDLVLGAVDAAAIATDAIDADAIAASAVTEIQAGLASAAAIAAVQADTDDIQARLPAALSAGRMRSHVEAMDTDVIGAAQIAAGAITASEAPALVNLDTPVSTRAIPGDAMSLVAGAVSAAAVATGAIDADALAADAVAEIADGVWDELLGGHLSPGSTGKALDDADAVSDPSAVADAVWDEARAGHIAAGSFGETVRVTPAGAPNLDTPVSTRAVPGDAMDLVPNAVDAAAVSADAVSEVADGVWNEALAGHLTPGSTGEALQNASDAGSPTQIAMAVWDEALPGVHAAGSAGERLASADDCVGTNLDVAVSTRSAGVKRAALGVMLNTTSNKVNLVAWFEVDGRIDASATAASIAFYDAATEALLFTLNDLVPSAQRTFFAESIASPPGVAPGTHLYAIATITAPGGPYVSGKSIAVVG